MVFRIFCFDQISLELNLSCMTSKFRIEYARDYHACFYLHLNGSVKFLVIYFYKPTPKSVLGHLSGIKTSEISNIR